MKHVPTDLDKLMWTIAESGDMAAADDFERRFPQFRRELAIRLGMVRSLKRSKPTGMDSDRSLPKFVPNETPVNLPRRPMWPVAVLGSLAFVAFASYLVVANLPKAAPVAPGNAPPVTVPMAGPPQDRENPKDLPSVSEGRVRPTQDGSGATNTPNPSSSVEMPWDKPQSVAIETAPLVDVLKLIADTCHLTIELAPEMPNPDVSIAYQNRTGMQMLRDLGRQYKFTPLDQGEGRVLIVPAIDFTNPQ
jgi:hypothetical protein